MPGSMPPTSQLDWLSSTTAMIVLFWSRATRDLLKSFGWGIAALHRLDAGRSCHFLVARPIASPGPPLCSAIHPIERLFELGQLLLGPRGRLAFYHDCARPDQQLASQWLRR